MNLRTFKILLLLVLWGTTLAVHAEVTLSPEQISQDIEVSAGKFQAAKVPPMDRAKASKAAAAAAMAGAAMSQVGCMRTMAEATKEENQDDKALLMMMAQMQCQQAAETMKAAQENMKNGEDMSSKLHVPKMATFEAGTAKLKGSGIEEPTLTFDDSAPKGEIEVGEMPEVEPYLPPAPAEEQAVAAAENPATPLEEEPLEGIAPPPEPVSGLAPLARGSVSFDDSSKTEEGDLLAGNNPLAAGGLSGFSPTGAGSGSKIEKAQDDDFEEDTLDSYEFDRGVRVVSDPPGQAAGGDGGGDSKKGSASRLDSLMSQIFGDREGPGPQGLDGGVLTEEKEPPVETRANIFEYASYRYSVAAGGGLIRSEKEKPARRLASIPKPSTDSDDGNKKPPSAAPKQASAK